MDDAQAGTSQGLAQGVTLGSGGHQECQHWQLRVQESILRSQAAQAHACLNGELPGRIAHKAALALITGPLAEDRQIPHDCMIKNTHAGMSGGVPTCTSREMMQALRSNSPGSDCRSRCATLVHQSRVSVPSAARLRFQRTLAWAHMKIPDYCRYWTQILIWLAGQGDAEHT